MNKKNILITGSGGVGVYSIYKRLKNKYKFYFADANLKNLNPKIPYKNAFKIPLATNKKDFKKKLHRYVEV